MNVLMPPLKFFDYVARIVEVDKSLSVLDALGFVGLPVRINGPDMLRVAIRETQKNSYRLNLEQIVEYNRRIFEEPQ